MEESTGTRNSSSSFLLLVDSLSVAGVVVVVFVTFAVSSLASLERKKHLYI